MSKHWKIVNWILTALVLFAALQSYSSFTIYAVGAVAVLAVSAAVNFFGIRHRFLVLPALFLLGFFASLATVSSWGARLFVALAGTYLFHYYQRHSLGEPPRFLQEVFTLTTAFLLINAVWAINYYFLPEWWIVMILSVLFVFPVFWQEFRGTQKGRSLAALQALVGTLVVLEITWVILFLPLHFFTAAVAGFIPFYLLLVLNRLHAEGRLTRKKVYFQIGLAVAVLSLSLASSPWLPLE